MEAAVDPLRQALASPSITINRINALVSFNSMLGEYAAKAGGYPNSDGRIVPMRRALEAMDALEYIQNVPAERIDEIKYVSDGSSYKVLIFQSGDCAVVHILRPELVDPTRSAGKLDCIAYGFWTPKGIDY